MAIIAPKPKGGNFLTPAGTFQAVCYGVWDIGLQEITWQGNTKKQHKIVVSWEIDSLIDSPDSEYHGKRYVISKRYTLSMSAKANLRKDCASWRGQDFTIEEAEFFDFESMVGANCMLNIIHKETEEATYANIGAVMALPKGTPKLSPENPALPPEWVKKLQDAQITVDDVPDVQYNELNPPPQESEDLPF